MAKISDILNLISDSIYPQDMYCICCGDTIAGGIGRYFCDDCMTKISWSATDFDCSGFSFNSVLSLVSYDYYAQRIVHNLKFHRQAHLAKPIGHLMGELYMETGLAPGAIFTSVPMHPQKEKERGYNQAALLAFYAAKAAGEKYAGNILLKTEKTASMRTARASGRALGLGNSIVLNPEMSDFVKNKSVVVVDDVVTTGSTAQSCALPLKIAGASDVTILCFASVKYKGND